ncbi:MAG: molybdopterin molybdotransferase MoeA [Vicinamibacteria bacterium]|nr:molybdopterin molybdotransferase MoeA [Vicinamibacteria bacterium]
MISVDEAQTVVLGHVSTLPAETVPLARAFSRILRAQVTADRDQPPFNRAAMDGFAVRSVDAAEPNARLRISGEVRAGAWPDRRVGEGEAMRIMTGAPVPEGADAVIQVERTKMAEVAAEGPFEVLLDASVRAGQNIVPRGSEARAGMVLLREGIRIGVPHLAVLASVGVADPQVSRAPRVAVIVTGDEVVDPGGQPTAAQIRNANGPALSASVRAAGGVPTDFGIVPDDAEKTRAAIQLALDQGHDAIVLSGGVSAGDFDFVEEVLGQLGVTLHVTAVRVKPGAPFVFGTRGPTLVFGLPGNPVSAQVTFELFARPALLKMQGAGRIFRPLLEATLEAPLANRSARRNYLPVIATQGQGGLTARPLKTQGSGDIVAHALANALAVLEPDRQDAVAGDRLLLFPLSSFLEV